MTPTQSLFDIVNAEGIALEYHRLPYPLLGHYFAEPDITPVITIIPTLEHRKPLMRCVLAEELGHHYTCNGDYLVRPYKSYFGRILIGSAEKKALKWAANMLLPKDELFAGRRTSLFEVSEAFGVTPGFVRAVFTLPEYKQKLYSVTNKTLLSGHIA